MSDLIEETFDEAEEFFAHYGVKGMKWGVRKDRGHEGEQVKLKKLPKLDKKWEKQFQGVNGFIKMNNAVADRLNGPNGGFAKVNNRPEYKNQDFNDLSTNPKKKALYDKYQEDIGVEVHSAFESAARSFGVNPSGTRRVGVSVDQEANTINFVMEEIRHDDVTSDLPIFTGQLNNDGFVVSLDKIEEADEDDDFLEQMESASDFFAHYGVKGMKWGRRRTDAQLAAARSKSGKVKEAPSDDAQRVGNLHARVKANRSTKPLSNKELRDAIDRMQLEQQYSKLSGGNDKSGRQKAREFVSAMIKNTLTGGQQSAQNIINQDVSSRMQAAYRNSKAA